MLIYNKVFDLKNILILKKKKKIFLEDTSVFPHTLTKPLRKPKKRYKYSANTH